MKRSKLILLGSLGVVALATIIVASPFAFKKQGGYSKNALSILQEKSADDAKAWFEARYFDQTTGERITAEKLKAIDKAVKNMTASKALPLTWEEKGPDNIAGRTRSIVVDKNNNNIIWAGSVTGGIFRSTNQGSTWSKVENYPGSKFIASMTQMANGNIVAATGMSYAGWSENWTGDGVWMTADNGQSWTLVGNTNLAAFSQIKEIVCAPNSNKLWMTTNSGLKSWTLGDAALTNIPSVSGVCSAVQISNDGSVIVAASNGNRTFVSTDGGATFVDRSGSSATTVIAGAGRIEYAISPTKNSQGKYTLYACRTSLTVQQGMNVSQDNGVTWTQFVGAASSTGNLAIYAEQAGYNSVVAVDPTDPQRIFIGGLDVWQWKQTTTTPIAGGFEKLSLWFVPPFTPKYVHADNHEFKFAANNRFYIGNDGGIGISNDFGNTFYPSNRGYNVSQFYGVAFDKFGAVLGGTQDCGTVYNDYTLSTNQEFVEVSGGDGIQCEISFWNPRVMFTTSQRGVVRRSIDKGQSTSDFVPDSLAQQGYTEAMYPFHTSIGLFEYFDPNSKDSVTYPAKKNHPANSLVRIPSASTGDTINYTTPTAMYYDQFVENKMSLTETRVSVVNNGTTFLLGNFNYTFISGAPTLSIGDSLLVQVPGGPDTIVVQNIGSYKWYFAQHPISNKIIPLGRDSTAQAVSWDTVRVADPFQSWFVYYINRNGGELWGTRNALRTNVLKNNWVRIAQGIGSNPGLRVDVEFSEDLNKCYIAAGNAVWRVDGLGDMYTSSPSFPATNSVIPNNATKVAVYTGSVEGIALNPNNENDLIVFRGTQAAQRAPNAGTATGIAAWTTLGAISGANSPITYDGIIDRDDSQIVVAGTHMGVFVSASGGASWTYSSSGFDGTPVYEVRQSYRTWNEGNSRPGEIYLATHGRGIFTSSSLLNVAKYHNSDNSTNLKAKLKTYPNPTSTSTTLSFDLDQAGTVYVHVYSITGTKVKSIETKMSKGDGLLDIEANDLPRGTYIVKLSSGNQSETTKFIKM